jgi:coenzyme F420-dependent glucose-6-phosphate dehydrogenase
MTRYFFGASHEHFGPEDLLRQAVEAEQAGFDGISASDHLQPWWPGGESGHAWIWLGAAAQATESLPVGTGVTPTAARYHPALIAQGWATLERMYPGRAFLGIGSGEALNEVPLGADWPSPGEQVERLEEALELIDRLWKGERVDHRGKHFSTRKAYLHSNVEGRRPPIYVSAFGPKAAAVAGRWGDGLWTLGDPERVPGLIDAYRGAADDAGREAGEILLHAGFSWASDEDAAFEGARVWKSAQVDEYYTEDWHEPTEMYEHAEANVSDEDLRESFIVSADPDVHAQRIRELEKLGASIVVLQNCSGAGPQAAIETYRDKVLPALRGS